MDLRHVRNCQLSILAYQPPGLKIETSAQEAKTAVPQMATCHILAGSCSKC